MKNYVLLFLLIVLFSCSKESQPKEDILTPTTGEKKIIDAATEFFGNGGHYYQIVNNYRVVLRPMLNVRLALTEGPCTHSIFQTECCCPWEFLLSPYDTENGGIANYAYPKSANFTAKPGKMEGSFAASFSQRPVSSDITEIHYDRLVFTGTGHDLNGIVMVKDVRREPSNNAVCTAEFINNSFSIASGLIQVSGRLSFTEGDAGGTLDVNYSGNRNVKADITLINMGTASFLQKAHFTVDGIGSDLDAEKQTITIGERTFKLRLD